MEGIRVQKYLFEPVMSQGKLSKLTKISEKVEFHHDVALDLTYAAVKPMVASPKISVLKASPYFSL